MKSIVYSYSNDDFIQIVNESTSYAECMRKLGYKSISNDSLTVLKRRISELNLSIEHFINTTHRSVRTKENVFCKDSTADQKTLRRHYYKEVPQTKCTICGQELFWNNKPLVLILDHINGNNHDNRLENLRWVCPNCNSQLDTTNARNPNHKKHYCEKCGKLLQDSQSSLCEECSGV